ncbi:hypothetical protein B0H13DRAFT_928878 [Mycena leptocephala]|nr:hypothetical protein B0H13DRAFT_928878 [Mycena leptocephala]
MPTQTPFHLEGREMDRSSIATPSSSPSSPGRAIGRPRSRSRRQGNGEWMQSRWSGRTTSTRSRTRIEKQQETKKAKRKKGKRTEKDSHLHLHVLPQRRCRRLRRKEPLAVVRSGGTRRPRREPARLERLQTMVYGMHMLAVLLLFQSRYRRAFLPIPGNAYPVPIDVHPNQLVLLLTLLLILFIALVLIIVLPLLLADPTRRTRQLLLLLRHDPHEPPKPRCLPPPPPRSCIATRPLEERILRVVVALQSMKEGKEHAVGRVCEDVRGVEGSELGGGEDVCFSLSCSCFMSR